VKPVRQALRLSYAAIAWTLITGILGVIVGIKAASTALVGTSADVLADMASSAMLVWRFRAELDGRKGSVHAEHLAEKVAAIALIVVAGGIAAVAILRLSSDSSPTDSPLTIVMAAVALVALPIFAVLKYRVAALVPSPALRMDGHITLVGAGMAAITLAGLGLGHAFGWDWADPVAALLVAALAFGIGLRSLLLSEGPEPAEV
jgi:divalent metal cation (Fe/Co/Zn/Cd) transporter